MKVGIKFCGGCQSRYNRRNVLEKIKENFPEQEYNFVQDNGHYDLIIEISGCPVKCADISKYTTENGIYSIDSDDITYHLEQLRTIFID